MGRAVFNLFHVWSESTGLHVLRLSLFPVLVSFFAMFYLHNHEMWSRMSLLPLANVLKHELIISKAIRSVTSRYIHIPTPIPASLLPFLSPVLLTFSLPLFFL